MTGQISNAKEIYEKIIKFGSTDFMPYYELAMLCIKTGDTDRAENMLKKVTKIEPKFANAHKDLAVIYLNKRLFDYDKFKELVIQYGSNSTQLETFCENNNVVFSMFPMLSDY